MKVHTALASLMVVVSPLAAIAQHPAGAPAPVSVAPREASQFDFLVGQWELTVRPRATSLAARIHGAPTLPGVWKAARALDGFGIQDELRITDRSGNPSAFSHAVRYYDVASKRWKITTLDVYRGRFGEATAEFRDGVMLVSSRGTDASGKPYLMRSRYFEITPTSFRFRQDRSTDDGRTWTEGELTIEAKRVTP